MKLPFVNDYITMEGFGNGKYVAHNPSDKYDNILKRKSQRVQAVQILD